MKIVILAPLFPPDVSDGALYAKQLCAALASSSDSITTLHYGQLPEAVPGVSFVSIKKDTSATRRLGRFLGALLSLRHAEAVIVLNGPSVELPLLLARIFLTGNVVYVTHDPNAALQPGRLKEFLRAQLKKYCVAHLTVPESLLTPPLIHPLLPTAPEVTAARRDSWSEHILQLKQLL